MLLRLLKIHAICLLLVLFWFFYIVYRVLRSLEGGKVRIEKRFHRICSYSCHGSVKSGSSIIFKLKTVLRISRSWDGLITVKEAKCWLRLGSTTYARLIVLSCLRSGNNSKRSPVHPEVRPVAPKPAQQWRHHPQCPANSLFFEFWDFCRMIQTERTCKFEVWKYCTMNSTKGKE